MCRSYAGRNVSQRTPRVVLCVAVCDTFNLSVYALHLNKNQSLNIIVIENQKMHCTKLYRLYRTVYSIYKIRRKELF
jgi:hypothetical protein